MPLIRALNSKVGVEDVQSVLTAVVEPPRRTAPADRRTADRVVGATHGRPSSAIDLAVRSRFLREWTTEPRRRRSGVRRPCRGHSSARLVASALLSATYIVDSPGDPCCLAITMHEMVTDSAYAEILLTDIFTAFAQRLAGEDIVLPAVHNVARIVAAVRDACHPSRSAWKPGIFGSTMPPRRHCMWSMHRSLNNPVPMISCECS